MSTTQSQLLGRSFLFLVRQSLQSILLPRIIRWFLLASLSLQSSPRSLIQRSRSLIMGSRCFMARWMLAAVLGIIFDTGLTRINPQGLTELEETSHSRYSKHRILASVAKSTANRELRSIQLTSWQSGRPMKILLPSQPLRRSSMLSGTRGSIESG